MILDVHPQAPSVPLYNCLKWLPFYDDAKITKCSIAFRRTRHTLPIYLDELLKLNTEQHNRKTRYSNINLVCPRFVGQTEGGRMFTTTTCQLWNSLSLNLMKSNSLHAFKDAMWNDLFNQQKSLNHFTV